MRKKLVVLVLAALSLAAHLDAQSVNLLEEDKQWTVEYADQVVLPPEIYQVHYAYEGDTTIGNTAYQKFGNRTFLREDTLERKVYLYAGDEECLLYDFNAGPGDTIGLCEGIRIVVDSITQWISTDGLLRKKFYVSSGEAINLEYYIEGIGTNLGFIEISEIIGPPAMDLMCVKKDDIEIYGERCEEVVPVLHRVQPKNSIHVYPNPAHGRIMVESVARDLRVQVVDINGKLVSEELLKGNEFWIKHHNPGLYFLFFYDENGRCVGKNRIVVMEQ